MNKEKAIDIMQCYSAMKKNGNSTFCSNMDKLWGHYAKWNKSDRERQISYDLTYMWNQKITLQTHRYREQTGGYQRHGVWMDEMDKGGLKGTNFQL